MTVPARALGDMGSNGGLPLRDHSNLRAQSFNELNVVGEILRKRLKESEKLPLAFMLLPSERLVDPSWSAYQIERVYRLDIFFIVGC